MSEGPSRLDSLLDSVGTWLFNIFDGFGWYIPALILTLLFFVIIALLCYATEDIPLDLGICRAPRAIFSWTEKRWRRRS